MDIELNNPHVPYTLKDNLKIQSTRHLKNVKNLKIHSYKCTLLGKLKIIKDETLCSLIKLKQPV